MSCRVMLDNAEPGIPPSDMTTFHSCKDEPNNMKGNEWDNDMAARWMTEGKIPVKYIIDALD